MVEVVGLAKVDTRGHLHGHLPINGDIAPFSFLLKNDFEFSNKARLKKVEQANRFIASQDSDPMLLNKQNAACVESLFNDLFPKPKH